MRKKRLTTCSLRYWLQRNGCALVLAALVPVGFLLRLYGMDWDRGFFFHPDERQILMVAAGLSWTQDLRELLNPASPLNPHFFAYGSFPIYLLRLLSALAGLWQRQWLGMDRFYLLGRLVPALFDTVTMIGTYRVARKVFGRRVAVLAATLVIFTVLHIQLAHFYTVDTLLTTLIVLTVNKAVDLAREGKRRDGAWLGALLGMALATKVSVVPLVAVPVVAWLAFAWPAKRRLGHLEEGAWRDEPRRIFVLSLVWAAVSRLRAAWARVRSRILLTLAIALLCFVLLQPYAVLDAYNFVVGIGQEIAMAQGWYDFPYTRQYAGTWPFLYQTRQILLFAMGPALGVLGICGLIWLSWRVWRHPWREGAVLLTWPLLYAAMQGAAYAKFIRYMLPLLPFLCLSGAALWVAAWDATASARSAHVSAPPSVSVWSAQVSAPSGRLQASYRRAVQCGLIALLAVVMASTVFYALAFLNIYRQPHPWLQATAWLCAQAPEGSTILTEYWDDPLPVQGAAEKGGCPHAYNWVTVDFHTLDNEGRLEQLLDAIQASDYIVLSSQRLYAALLRRPERYPLACRYYQQLFAERLGFRLVAAPAVYPQAAGITLLDNPRSGLPLATPPLLAASRPPGWVLDLGQADESFTVYDHPQPLIFARVERLSREQLWALLVLKP